ncbi:MAG TPA: sigma-70 family RNA polymerase sigma factor [Solirubrobacteraceae bacterium]|jgi:RNA polymerase sigma factor for flagellar operon FliA|nr:sigma-70 family RNA polymerase sigma factor [Solirubrobacteraceae bacterium]
MSHEALLSLWRTYKEGGDISARDRLVFSLAPVVKAIVYRKIREIPAYREVDDFISCGLEALIKSIDRYDPDKGATLEQFAWTRIHGAVLDELRRYDWAPRSLRRMEREMNRARERFNAIHGRAPDRAELAQLLAISRDELEALISDLDRSDVGSLNATLTADDDNAAERIDVMPSSDRDTDPEHVAMREGAVTRFRVVFDQLPDRERKVALLLHVNNLTLREVGEVLGVSESRVCQIHGKLKRGLRERLSADELLLFLEVA